MYFPLTLQSAVHSLRFTLTEFRCNYKPSHKRMFPQYKLKWNKNPFWRIAFFVNTMEKCLQ